jgi:hypothetical protein
MRITIAVLAVLFATSAAHAAKKETQKGTLTLSCDGTRVKTITIKDTGSTDFNTPITNLGVVIDYAKRFVDSVEFVGYFDEIDPASIYFQSKGGDKTSGTIDRVSGATEVSVQVINRDTHALIESDAYHLHCKPAKRMF